MSEPLWKSAVRRVVTAHANGGYRTQAETAQGLGMTNTDLSMSLRVARDLESPRIQAAASLREAYELLRKADGREREGWLQEISLAGRDLNPPFPISGPRDVVCADFLTWKPPSDLEPFSLIHCDFPCGAETGPWEVDSKDIYWRLVNRLCTNIDTLMGPNSHLILWVPPHLERHVRVAFGPLSGMNVQFDLWPLIWHKSDYRGAFTGRPWHSYEMALLGTRGDRPTICAKAASYGCPTVRSSSPSIKPVPMLSHFFSMLVDGWSSVFDPCCEQGNALVAAERLGAERVLGLERDPGLAKAAHEALHKARLLRKASQI